MLLLASVLFVLLVAVRMQYLPVALIVMGIVLLRAGPIWPVATGCSLLLALCVGVFDAVSWDGGLFHSYIVNAGYNFYIVNLLSFTFPVWQYLVDGDCQRRVVYPGCAVRLRGGAPLPVVAVAAVHDRAGAWLAGPQGIPVRVRCHPDMAVAGQRFGVPGVHLHRNTQLSGP